MKRKMFLWLIKAPLSVLWISALFIPLLCGCSSESAWIEKYADLISGFKIGRTVSLPVKGPNGLAWDGTCLWVAGYQSGTPGEIAALDLDSLKVIKSGKVLPHMEGLAWNGNELLVGAPANRISRIDAKSLKVTETFDSPSGEDADGLAWDGACLWVASHYHGRRNAEIIKVDWNTRKKLKVIQLPFKEIGDIAYGKGCLWAVRFSLTDDPRDMPFIVKIDPESGKILELLSSKDLPKHLWGLTWAEGSLWIAEDISSEPKMFEVIMK